MKSFDNAFSLLTDDAKEIENYTMRSDMMDAISDLIQEHRWTQKEAAKNLGVTQPRISNLKNGNISKFSVDMLMGMLAKLGVVFEFNYTPKTKPSIGMSVIVNEVEV